MLMRGFHLIGQTCARTGAARSENAQPIETGLGGERSIAVTHQILHCWIAFHHARLWLGAIAKLPERAGRRSILPVHAGENNTPKQPGNHEICTTNIDAMPFYEPT